MTEIAISNVTELQNMKNDLNGHYYLANDIDCAETRDWNEGAGFEPVGLIPSFSFLGTLDGRGHKISNLFINRPTSNDVGLFGHLESTAIVQEVLLIDADITGWYYVGALAGHHGFSVDTISKCCASGSVKGTNYVGGLVGLNDGSISKCYSLCSIIASSVSGGLAGVNYGSLSNVYSAFGTVNNESTFAGSLVGANLGTIKFAFSTSPVKGATRLGGIVGINDFFLISGAIISSFGAALVTGSGFDYLGGIAGENYGTITNSFWDVYRSGMASCIGGGDGSTECAPKNADNSEPDYWFFKANPPMDLWDFISVWATQEGISFPYFQWQELCDAPCPFLGEE